MAENALVISLDTKPAVDSLNSLTTIVKNFSEALSSIPQGLPKGFTNSLKEVVKPLDKFNKTATESIGILKSFVDGFSALSALKGVPNIGPSIDAINTPLKSFSKTLNNFPKTNALEKLPYMFRTLADIGPNIGNMNMISSGMASIGSGINQFSKSLQTFNKLDDFTSKIRQLRSAISILITSFAELTTRADYKKFLLLADSLERVATIVSYLRTQAPGLANALFGVGKSTDNLNLALKDTTGNLRLFVGGWRAAIAAFLGGTVIYSTIRAMKDLVSTTIDFDFMLRRINTMARLNESELAAVGQTMLDVSSKYGLAKRDITEAMYAITSATIKGAGALEVLKASAEFAVAGATDIKSSAELVSRVIMAYGKSAYAAADVTDIMFKTIERGISTAEELNHDLGKVLATAASAKVAFSEIGTAVATLTARGLQTNIATTSLNALLLKLNSNTKKLTPLFKRLGFESSSAALQTLGLSKTMQLLEVATGGSVDGLIQLGFNYRDVRAATILANDSGAVYVKNLQEINDAAKRAGSSTEAFKEIQKSLSQQLKELTAGIENVGMALVDWLGKATGVSYILGLANAFVRLRESSNPFLSVVSNLVSISASFIGKIALWSVSIYGLIKAITLLSAVSTKAFFTILLPAFEALTSGIKTATTAMNGLTLATLKSNAAALANPYVIAAALITASFLTAATIVQNSINNINKAQARVDLSKATSKLNELRKSYANLKTEAEKSFALKDLDARLASLTKLKDTLGDSNVTLNALIKNYADLYEQINNSNAGLDESIEKIQALKDKLEEVRNKRLLQFLEAPAESLYVLKQYMDILDQISNTKVGSVAFYELQIQLQEVGKELDKLIKQTDTFWKNLTDAFSKPITPPKTDVGNIISLRDKYITEFKKLADTGILPQDLLSKFSWDSVASMTAEEMDVFLKTVRGKLEEYSNTVNSFAKEEYANKVGDILSKSFGISQITTGEDLKNLQNISNAVMKVRDAYNGYNEAIISGNAPVQALLGRRLELLKSISTVQLLSTGSVNTNLSKEITDLQGISDGYADINAAVLNYNLAVKEGNKERGKMFSGTGYLSYFTENAASAIKFTDAESTAIKDLENKVISFNRVLGKNIDLSEFQNFTYSNSRRVVNDLRSAFGIPMKSGDMFTGYNTNKLLDYAKATALVVSGTDNIKFSLYDLAKAPDVTPELDVNAALSSIQEMANLRKEMPNVADDYEKSVKAMKDATLDLAGQSSKIQTLTDEYKALQEQLRFAQEDGLGKEIELTLKTKIGNIFAEITKEFADMRKQTESGAFSLLPKQSQVNMLKSRLQEIVSNYNKEMVKGNIVIAEGFKNDMFNTAKTLSALIGNATSGTLTSSTVTALEVGSQAAFDVLAATSKRDYVETISTNVSSILTQVKDIAKGSFNQEPVVLSVVI